MAEEQKHNIMTAESLKKLQERYDYLLNVKRKEIINAIEIARGFGDLSENAEYDAAKEMQGHIEGRIAELEGKIPMLQIIDPKTLQAGERIVFGATVELEDEDSGNTKSYQIVGDDEADIKENRISISSPLARSLIGKFEGDEVTCPAPKGLIHYAIISVKYVTDIIGQNSVKHWEDKLADARQGLSHYFNVLKERI